MKFLKSYMRSVVSDMEEVVAGRHAVKALLRSEQTINKIFIQDSANRRQLEDILKLAKANKVNVQFAPKNKLDGLTDERHQGVVAMTSPQDYMDIKELISKCEHPNSHVMILDGLEDPHNLGSILRTADATGFKGIIIPKHRAVGLTSTVAKTSTGAIQHVPVSRVGNINQTIDQLKDAGFWIVGTDGDAKTDYRDIPGDVNLAIIIGNEGNGISKKTLEKCDFTVRIPMVGSVTSLNASVSAALLMYEVYRKHQPRTSKG